MASTASTVSSYLSKSKKDFKPKAPLRRSIPAAASSQASVRGSVDRQLQPLTTHPLLSSDQSLENTTNEQIATAASTAQRRSSSVAEPTPRSDVADGATPSTTYRSSQQARPSVEQTEDIQAPLSNALGTATSVNRRKPTAQEATRVEGSSAATLEQDHSLPGHSNNLYHQPEDGSQLEPERPLKRRKVIATQAARAKTNQATRTDAGAGTVELQLPARTASNDQESLGQQTRSSRLQKRSQARTIRKPRADSDLHNLEVSTTIGQSKRAPRHKRTTVRRGKPRPTSPEHLERLLEPDSMRMSDLCMDNGKGKKSGRETRLEERDAETRQTMAQNQTEPLENGSASTDGHAPNDEPARSARTDEPRGASRLVPTLQLVNGQLVLDEASRIIDRHADAEATRPPQEEQVEDDLSRKINGGTFMKRTSSTRWTEECNQMFFDGLRMFGTDFGMISKLFPGRTRRHIKLKYDREERSDPDRITEALDEPIPVDMESFSRISNTEYKDPSELESTMAEDRQRLEEEQAREKEAMDELIRQRADEAAAESAAVGGQSAEADEAGAAAAGVAEAERGPRSSRRGRKAGSGAGKRASKASTTSGRRSKPSDGGIVLGPI